MNVYARSLRYVFPIILIAILTAFKYFFLFDVAVKVPFILYFGGVLLSAYMWGVRSAVIAVITATLAALYFFIEPFYSFELNENSLGRMLLFLSECLVILFLAANFHRAKGLAQNEQKRFQLLIERSSDGIVMFNKSGKPVYASPSIERIVGYTPEEFKKTDRSLLVFPDDVPMVQALVADLMKHPGKSVTVEHKYRHKDGRWVIIETVLTNLLHEDGINALVSNFRDITDRIALEKQREDFIGIVSHELKTPLTTLKGYHQLAEGNTDMLPDAHRKIGVQIKKMERLVQDILDTTALMKDKIELHRQPVNINNLIQDSVQNLRLAHVRQQIQLKLGHIPEIECDEYRISQVVSNLLNNAAKYSPADSTVTIETSSDANNVHVKIIDEGVGLNETQKQSVFKRFYRGGINISGLGLGLYISAQIIKMHNGSIGVQSEEGKGSCFWFTLPIETTQS